MSGYILIILLIVISLWDIKTFQIPAPFIIVGLLLGLGTSFFTNGSSGLFSSLFALLIVFIITFTIWAIGESFFGASIIGAGDMKLLMVISTFMGIKLTFLILYWSVLLAGFLFLFMIAPKEIFGLFRNVFHFFVYAIPKSNVVTKKIAFSVPITIATCYFIFF